jgi:hypothetical protein
VQDGGPFPSSLIMTLMKSKLPAVAMSYSAGGVKGPPDLNYSTCRYFLEGESALRDATMNSRVARYAFFTHVQRGLEIDLILRVVYLCSFICNVQIICHIIWTVSGIFSYYAASAYFLFRLMLFKAC